MKPILTLALIGLFNSQFLCAADVARSAGIEEVVQAGESASQCARREIKNGRTFDGAFLEVSTDKQNWTRLSSELSVPYNGTIDAIS